MFVKSMWCNAVVNCRWPWHANSKHCWVCKASKQSFKLNDPIKHSELTDFLPCLSELPAFDTYLNGKTKRTVNIHSLSWGKSLLSSWNIYKNPRCQCWLPLYQFCLLFTNATLLPEVEQNVSREYKLLSVNELHMNAI